MTIPRRYYDEFGFLIEAPEEGELGADKDSSNGDNDGGGSDTESKDFDSKQCVRCCGGGLRR